MKDNSWVAEIKNAPKIKKYSQAGEEGYITFIMDQIGWGDKFLVDIGASDGGSNSNSAYFMEMGVKGILMDGDNKGNPNVHQEWITKENVAELLHKYSCPEEFSFLSLDLDGNDYDIIYEILHHFWPRLVVCEINGTIPLGVRKKIVYNPEHKYNGDDYYGFSFSAAETLATHNGYTVVFQNDALNVYMVRNDLLGAYDLDFLDFKVPFQHLQYHPHNPNGEWEMVVEP